VDERLGNGVERKACLDEAEGEVGAVPENGPIFKKLVRKPPKT
jgi:hypothetical protein